MGYRSIGWCLELYFQIDVMMNARPLAISLLGLMFLLQPIPAQKLLRTEYRTLFSEFQVLPDSLRSDKYRYSFYSVNDWPWWECHSNGVMTAIGNPFAIDCDSITFCGEALVGNGHTVDFILRQKATDHPVHVGPSSEWQRINITQPFVKSMDKWSLMFRFTVQGSQKGTTYLKNINVLLDGKPMDECCPLPPANADHEFDTSSMFR